MTESTQDAGRTMMALFIQYLITKLEAATRKEDPIPLPAAEQEVIRKLLADNSITLASVQRGDFGETARKVAEDFPFPGEEGRVMQ